MRLNAFLARAGIASRRGADTLVADGRVTVNGALATPGMQVDERDEVAVDGERVGRPQRLRHVLLHKPRGVVTTAADPEGRPTVVGLVGGDVRIVPVGRLDAATSGALLLTNDGELAYRLSHPRFEVEKAYVVTVEGEPDDATLRTLATGVQLEDGPTAPARVRRLGPSRLELVLHEGRNRQVRRMCEAVGHPVRRLHGPRYAGLGLDGLAPGTWRDLRAEEIRRLRKAVGLDSPEAPERGRGGSRR